MPGGGHGRLPDQTHRCRSTTKIPRTLGQKTPRYPQMPALYTGIGIARLTWRAAPGRPDQINERQSIQSLRLFLDHRNGDGAELMARGEVEFCEDMAEVILDGFGADIELFGGLLV